MAAREVGLELKARRQSLGLSLEAVVADTRIPLAHLVASAATHGCRPGGVAGSCTAGGHAAPVQGGHYSPVFAHAGGSGRTAGTGTVPRLPPGRLPLDLAAHVARRQCARGAFAPGAEFGSAKRWPASHFAQLAQLIRHAYPDAQVALLGSGKDRAVCEEIVAAAPWVQNFAGVTTLDQAIAMLAKAEVVVSNDSGLMNIASALNRPIIGLYGPTDSSNTPPFSDVAKILSLHLDCAPCRQRECPLGHHHCMRNMSADMVWTPLRAILGERCA